MFPDGTAFRFDIKTQMERSAPSNGLFEKHGGFATFHQNEVSLNFKSPISRKYLVASDCK